MAAVGPVPPSLEPVAFAVLGVMNIVAATIVAVVFSAGRRVFRFRWIVFGATGTVLLAFCVMASRWAEEANSRQVLLRRVVMLEQSSDRNDWGKRQELSTALAILGRQREAREIPLHPDEVGHELCDPPDTPDSDPPFVVTPWREAMTRIAAEQRLVLIMEAHTVTEHRAWIEQTLGFLSCGRVHPLFRRDDRRIRLDIEIPRISDFENRVLHARSTIRESGADGHPPRFRSRRL